MAASWNYSMLLAAIGSLAFGQAAGAKPVKPMDLQWSATDPQGLPKNPSWAVQKTLKAGQFPDPVKLCRLDKIHAWSAYAVDDNPAQLKGCTDNRVGLDVVRWVASGPICWGVFPGHADWLQAVTFDGHIWQDGKPMWGGGLDNDYSFNFAPADPSGKSITNLFTKEFGACTDPFKPSCAKFRNRGLHLETWNSESVSMFLLPFWKKYAAEVDAHADSAAVLDGRPAIATGLVSLDCAHNCHVELHPLFALAVQDHASAKSEHWSFFAKNWGNGGYCSSTDFYWNFPEEGKGKFVYRFHIPWKKGAKSFTTKLSYYLHADNDDALKVASATIHGTPQQGIVIKVVLPDHSQHGVYEGETEINWVMDPKAKPAPAPPPPHKPEARVAKREHDNIHEELLEQLSASQRKALPSAQEPVRRHHSTAKLVVEKVSGPLEAPAKHAEQAAHLVHNAAKEQRMKAHYEALRKAFGSDAAFQKAAQASAVKLEIPPERLQEMLKKAK